MKLRQQALARVHRLVIKVGSGVVGSGMEPLIAQIAQLRRDGRQVILVSSGAIAAGMGVLGLKQRPKSLAQLQACAAIGQGKLMAAYDGLFGKHGLHVAQVLLTHDDLRSRQRHLNARNTLLQLLDDGVIPVINENDTVAVEEIKFGDNDRLSALVATLVDADLLIILSHVEGLYRNVGRVPPRGGTAPAAVSGPTKPEVISIVPAITREIEALAGGTDRQTSVGGMKSKIESAKIVTRAGIPLVIADGEAPDVLPGILAQQDIGTIFLSQGARLESRKRWIAFFQHPTGKLFVDDGAKRALCDTGKSLLAKGVTRREGDTLTGNVVSICDITGNEFARGLTRDGNVLVHRDDLVIL
jgi:glutamate 5-kinase